MPELPDVEIFRQYFEQTSLQQEIINVHIFSEELIKTHNSKDFISNLIGHIFVATARYGKYFFAKLDNNKWMVFHFGMTGYFKYFKDLIEDTPYDRLRIDYSNGYHLVFDCKRKLGEIRLIDRIEDFILEKNLGPDPLASDFSYTYFKKIVSSKKGALKNILMNQQIMSGIGNIYSDEILFQAKIHPKAKIEDISDEGLKNIFETIQNVLRTAINCQAEPNQMPKTYILLQRHQQGKCPCCGNMIKKAKISGRTAYFCPNCQQE